eukprot:TRINITY_DN1962_c0_g2_i1.p1 TRINITY_DN1962_c0_g2~~TRINITY_DN1962_c0_g2_i1.p1  ORF type:complete len:440 (-),score=105.29 TRINITY_DN1962_c0_g2_i1:73-1392(-)
MKMFLLLASLAAAFAAPAATSPFTYGHAAYTYGPLHCVPDPCEVVPSCNKAHWASNIGDFNSDTSISDVAISQVYSYGGDVEFWPTSKTSLNACWAPADPATCNATSYYDNNNRLAAAEYAKAPGVKSITALLDARMDGWQMISDYNSYDACNFGDFYPNLNNLTAPQIETLAEHTAKLYCADPNVGGIQVDLEPYQPPYKDSLEAFVAALSSNMKDSDSKNGCRDAAHPSGRTTSYFTFAHRMDPGFYNRSMGENGIYVFSGYDLKPKNLAFEYNNVSEFGTNLEEEIATIRAAIGPNGKFTLALPIAASCHEYEQYIPMHGDGCGPACQMFDANKDQGITMDQYVQKAMDIVTDPKWGDLFKLKEGGQFLGLSFWTWTYDMTYPPMKWFNNVFLPPTPSTKTLNILKTCLLYTSDAADEEDSVDLGGRRIIKKKKKE